MVHPVNQSFVDRVRLFEERLQKEMPEFRCAVHLCLGQEAVPALLYEHIRKGDFLFSTHRSHGHYLAKGGTERQLYAEILGHSDGVNGGFSGSQSFCDTSINFHSTAIVGGLIGVATGAAMALKLLRSESIVVCCIGDAATEQGVFWESLNFAALHRLPVLWICENNELSVHAPLYARQAAPLGARVQAFGVNYLRGLRMLELTLATRKKFPAFVEVLCTRESNHVSAMEDLRE